MKNLPWSALAMCIDCEGTLSVTKKQKSVHVDCYQTEICVVNTDKRLMSWLISNFGGRYYSRDRHNSRHKISYAWRVTGRNNKEKVILGILPYLILKKEQARLLLDFLRMDIHERNPEKRYILAMQCQALNAKGPAQTTNTLDDSEDESKIESELMGDHESAPPVTAGTANAVSKEDIKCTIGEYADWILDDNLLA